MVCGSSCEGREVGATNKMVGVFVDDSLDKLGVLGDRL